MSAHPAKRSGAINYNRSSKPDFNRAAMAQPTKEQRRESFMVKRDRPAPVLRPAPHIAAGPDRVAFNQAWKQEDTRARAAQPKPQTGVQKQTPTQSASDNLEKMRRKAEFMARRPVSIQPKSKARNR